MVMEGEQGGVRPRNGVNCTVDWTQRSVSPSEIEEFGELVDEVSVNVFISPEAKTPKGMPNEALEWTCSEELHPFWFVKRGKPEDKPNMKLMFITASEIVACDIKHLVAAGASVEPIMEAARITYPCLENTVDSGPDEELILEWSQAAVQAPPRVAYFPPKSPLELMQMPTWDPHRTPPREPKAQVVVGENAHVQPCHDRLA